MWGRCVGGRGTHPAVFCAVEHCGERQGHTETSCMSISLAVVIYLFHILSLRPSLPFVSSPFAEHSNGVSVQKRSTCTEIPLFGNSSSIKQEHYYVMAKIIAQRSAGE